MSMQKAMERRGCKTEAEFEKSVMLEVALDPEKESARISHEEAQEWMDENYPEWREENKEALAKLSRNKPV